MTSPSMPPRPIEGPSAWRGAAMAKSEEWTEPV